MLAPTPGTFGLAGIDPDDLPTSPDQFVEHPAAPFQMDEAGLADGRIGTQHHRQISVLKIRNRMDQGTVVDELCSGKLIVAVLAAGGKDVTGAQSAHKSDHRQGAEGVEGQRIAEVESHRMGTVLVHNGPQPLSKKGAGLSPGDSFVAASRITAVRVEER